MSAFYPAKNEMIDDGKVIKKITRLSLQSLSLYRILGERAGFILIIKQLRKNENEQEATYV